MKVEITTELGIYGDCKVARVTLQDGSRIQLSRYPAETGWLADSVFAANGYPVYVEGIGSRCTLKRSPSPELLAAITQAETGA